MRAILAALFLCTALAAAQAAEPSQETIARGKALVDAGDCSSCHTSDPAKPFAGGVRIETPFGAITSPNLTPDRETGIGGLERAGFLSRAALWHRARRIALLPGLPLPLFREADARGHFRDPRLSWER